MATAPLDASTVETSRRAEAYLSSEELAPAAGISSVTLARLVSLGLVEPTALRGNERRLPVFSAEAASRLRRMLRLHATSV